MTYAFKNTTVVSGLVRAFISGDAVDISGQIVQANISGQQVEISGQPVSISGQPISLTSGTIVIGQSGLNVVVQSGVFVMGTINVAASADISGESVVLASGGVVDILSGAIIGIVSGQNVVVQSGLFVMGTLTGSTSVSGQPIALMSGTMVIDQSGLNVVVQSGIYVMGSITTTTDISGQLIGLISGTAVIIQSGSINITTKPPQAVRIRAPQMISDISGGVTLISGIVVKALIRSLDGDVYIGGSSGIDMPYSGFGMLIQQDDRLTIPIDNFNLINACAVVSGYRISYGGVQ